jgi:hypothetical protein
VIGPVLAAFVQPWKRLERLLDRKDARLGTDRAHPEVLANREIGKQLPFLRNVSYPAARLQMLFENRDVLAVERYRPAIGTENAHDRAKRRRLAGPVTTDERGDLSALDCQRYAAENAALAVGGM